jgi:hypothetical protein
LRRDWRGQISRWRIVVKDTVGIFAGIPPRNEPEDPNDQPETVAVILVDYDGVLPVKAGAWPSG